MQDLSYLPRSFKAKVCCCNPSLSFATLHSHALFISGNTFVRASVGKKELYIRPLPHLDVESMLKIAQQLAHDIKTLETPFTSNKLPPSLLTVGENNLVFTMVFPTRCLPSCLGRSALGFIKHTHTPQRALLDARRSWPSGVRALTATSRQQGKVLLVLYDVSAMRGGHHLHAPTARRCNGRLICQREGSMLSRNQTCWVRQRTSLA